MCGAAEADLSQCAGTGEAWTGETDETGAETSPKQEQAGTLDDALGQNESIEENTAVLNVQAEIDAGQI